MAQNSGFVVYRARAGDTAARLAERFLGSADRAWEIQEFNDLQDLRAGQEVVIPLRPPNPVGVYPTGYQTVPILCYHRFGDRAAKMVVSPQAFAQQMQYLADHGYRVVRLSDLPDFLAGRRALPRRSVVVTMDDGYRSNYLHAYPVLQRHRFPATIFLYTDFLGAGAALRKDEMREMLASGLVDIQPHSKAHTNLALPGGEEDAEAYRQRVVEEVEASRRILERLLGVEIRTFAYPYGDTNTEVIQLLREQGFALGATVRAGGNPAFAHPYMLRRTMIYGEDDLETFAAKLETFVSAPL